MKDQFGNEIVFGARLFVKPMRKDGKYPVTYLFMSSGRTIKKIITKETLEEEIIKGKEQYEIIYNK